MIVQDIAEDSAPKPRVGRLALWVARVVTVLAGVSAVVVEDDLIGSVVVIAVYGVVLTFLVRKPSSPVAYGMQLGIGMVVTTAALILLRLFSRILDGAVLAVMPFAGVTILVCVLLNFLMIPSAVHGYLRFAKDREAKAKFYLSSVLTSIIVLGYLIFIFL